MVNSTYPYQYKNNLSKIETSVNRKKALSFFIDLQYMVI